MEVFMLPNIETLLCKTKNAN